MGTSTLNTRELELAILCGADLSLEDLDIEKFYNLAHRDGQKQMRERAAKEVYPLLDGDKAAGFIRELEIE